jgi:hypothetical protein
VLRLLRSDLERKFFVPEAWLPSSEWRYCEFKWRREGTDNGETQTGTGEYFCWLKFAGWVGLKMRGYFEAGGAKGAFEGRHVDTEEGTSYARVSYEWEMRSEAAHEVASKKKWRSLG